MVRISHARRARFSRIKIHAYYEFNVQKFVRKKPKYKSEKLTDCFEFHYTNYGSTSTLPKINKLTRSQVSKTRGNIAGTKYVRSGSKKLRGSFCNFTSSDKAFQR